MKKFDLALEDLTKSIKISPSGEAYFYRGAVKDLMKDKNGACQDLTKARDMGNEEAVEKLRRLCGKID